jgi:hypothetical protein
LALQSQCPPPVDWGEGKEPLLKLQPWVVEEGLRRSRRRAIKEGDMEDGGAKSA